MTHRIHVVWRLIRDGLQAAVGRRWVHYEALGAVLIWLVFLAAAPQSSESPTEAVRGTVTRVMSILEDPALKAQAKLIPRRRMLEEVIASRFDYAEMSKLALAADWTPLTEVQRVEFVALFQQFLSDRYARGFK